MLTKKDIRILSIVNKNINYENGLAISAATDYNVTIKKTTIEQTDNKNKITLPFNVISDSFGFINKKTIIYEHKIKCVCLDFLENSLVIVATDSQKLYKRTINTENSLVIQKNISLLTIRILKLINPKTITFSIDSNNNNTLVINAGNFTIYENTLFDKYVKYNSILENNFNTYIKINKDDIINILDTVNKEALMLESESTDFVETDYNCIALTDNNTIISYKPKLTLTRVCNKVFENNNSIEIYKTIDYINTDNVILCTSAPTAELTENIEFSISKDNLNLLSYNKTDNLNVLSYNIPNIIKFYKAQTTYNSIYLLQINSIDSIK